MTQKGFEGCIHDVQLGQTQKDINDNVEIKDIQQGCSEVTNSKPHVSYILLINRPRFFIFKYDVNSTQTPAVKSHLPQSCD